MKDWSQKTEIPASRFVGWLGIAKSTLYVKMQGYGLTREAILEDR